jgi:hypothetical protein
VTLKAIHFYACIRVATPAELGGIVDGNRFTVLVHVYVTVDTSDQAVPFRSDSLVHGFVALTEEKSHMIPAHDFDGFYTALCITKPCPRLWPRWFNDTTISPITCGQNQHTSHRKQNQIDGLHRTGPSGNYSPIPISI